MDDRFVPLERLDLSPKSPLESAREFVQTHCMKAGVRTLHHHDGAFYQWTGTQYAESHKDALRAAIYRFLDDDQASARAGSERFNPNRKKVDDVLDALAAEVNLDVAIRPPAWLDDKAVLADFHPEDIIACSNGLLHLPTRQLLPHTPAFFTHNAVDFAYDADTPKPKKWLRFLRQLWRKDSQAIRTLQEMFGCLLTPDTSQQKAFLIVGPKRGGKGTIARVLRKLLGPDNVIGPTLTGMSQQFGLQPFINKRLAIIPDARLGPRADQHFIAERVLSITGEDTLTIDRKYQSSWTGKLPTRILILSNELLRLSDASGTLPSRFIVLMLQHSFYGKEDHNLANRLFTEISGIFNWAIEGWQRLNKRGHFVQPDSSEEALRDLEDLSSPMHAFVRDECLLGKGYSVALQPLYSTYVRWCGKTGINRPDTSHVFGKNLRAAVPELHVSRPRDGQDRPTVYEGLKLRSFFSIASH
jgi:putative DNA primase/helicase